MHYVRDDESEIDDQLQCCQYLKIMELSLT